MAHKVIDGKVVVDWTAGDPEGDRIHVLAAYRDFVNDIITFINDDPYLSEGARFDLQKIIKKWNVSTGNQIDEVPRIWIKRPE